MPRVNLKWYEVNLVVRLKIVNSTFVNSKY